MLIGGLRVGRLHADSLGGRRAVVVVDEQSPWRTRGAGGERAATAGTIGGLVSEICKWYL